MRPASPRRWRGSTADIGEEARDLLPPLIGLGRHVGGGLQDVVGGVARPFGGLRNLGNVTGHGAGGLRGPADPMHDLVRGRALLADGTGDRDGHRIELGDPRRDAADRRHGLTGPRGSG
ncbi:hypothetical protein [Methylorubrum populi]|uniref:hypothetical protein n=1 Tax=Methylorubrum populi TaxID=223967 RepID=UPI000BBAF6F6|nr:hypothetical protein [Methylorubrum populi]